MEKEILDNEMLQIEPQVSVQVIISTEKFIFLSIITFGIYPLWWIYKAWRFFKQLEKSDTIPLLRTIFSIVYLYNLFDKIQAYADEKGIEKRYSTDFLFTSIIVVNFLGRLPFPYSLISLSSCLFFLKPMKALNFAKENASEITCKRERFLNIRQILLVLAGIILWYFIIRMEFLVEY